MFAYTCVGYMIFKEIRFETDVEFARSLKTFFAPLSIESFVIELIKSLVPN